MSVHTFRPLLSLTLVLSACQGQPASTQAPTLPAQIATTVPTVAPTRPSPTSPTIPQTVTAPPAAAPATARPTATPVVTPDVAEFGPYLAFRESDINCRQTLVVVDHDGHGLRRLPLPRACDFRADFRSAVSPDGRYLAAFLGNDASEIDDVAVRLMVVDLSWGWIALDLPLVSDAFPDDFWALYEREIANHEGGHGDVYSQFEYAVLRAMQTVRWSPNSRYLAFGSQADGPSTDLYVYDTQTFDVRRLSDGPEHIVSIVWSPDGRRLLSGSSDDFLGGYPTIHYHVTDLQADGNVAVGGGPQAAAYWLDATHVYIYAQRSPAAAIRGLRHENGAITNVSTGQTIPVWDGVYDDLGFSWVERTTQVTGCRPVSNEDWDCGLYTVDLTTGAATFVDGLGPLFGEPTETGIDDHQWIDNDGNYLIDFGGLYSVGSKRLGRLDVPKTPATNWWEGIDQFILAPDGRHAFVVRDRTLFAVTVGTGEMSAIVDGLENSSFTYTWLPNAPLYEAISVGSSEPAPAGEPPSVRR